MILLYTSLLMVLGTLGWLVNRRVKGLEKKYTRTAADVELLFVNSKPGNSKLDTVESAKRQFLLGQLVQKRDSLEGKCHAWQSFAEKFDRVVTALREAKGRKLPYTMGVLDVSAVLYAIDHFGVGDYVNVRNVVEVVTAHMAQ